MARNKKPKVNKQFHGRLAESRAQKSIMDASRRSSSSRRIDDPVLATFSILPFGIRHLMPVGLDQHGRPPSTPTPHPIYLPSSAKLPTLQLKSGSDFPACTCLLSLFCVCVPQYLWVLVLVLGKAVTLKQVYLGIIAKINCN